ncbi:peptidoglycan binding protein CsiV [Shewanella sp. UCD-KL12]|uniref:peptidoglycan binding protein CsiV n=1 Tax=Shewanella sp. UCD-KL12 TaxID=1917163 RepID=UPI000970FACE|nr:peptidoglycan binding protein CsiV [Shewanella sp. UCD-KL12]
MLRQPLFIIALLFSSNSAFAQEERWFEVEVYLFERNNSLSQEQAPKYVPAQSRKKAVDLITPIFSTSITGSSLDPQGCSSHDWATNADTCNQEFTSSQVNHLANIPWSIAAPTEQYGQPGGPAVLLSNEQNQFADIISKLSREKGNKSLLHMTWQQSMLPRHRAMPVKLFSGQDYSDRFELNGQSVTPQETSSDIPQFDFLGSSFSLNDDKPVWELDGTLNIYLDHYLYVETALNLREEGTKVLEVMSRDADSDEGSRLTTPFLYAHLMKQNRRLRSDQIHYFDHPRMGMILQIRKMQQPLDRIEEESTQLITEQ